MKLNRINEIESYLIRNGTATIPELLAHFGVSLNTLRRDINVLCKRGSASKVYGGIVYNRENNVEPYSTRSSLHVGEKARIGQLASRFIEDGDTIYLDSGSTTAHLLQHVRPGAGITIISNSLNVFAEAAKYPHLNIISTGGLFYHKTHSFVGMAAVAALADYHIGKAFMAATGIGRETGAANNSFHEAEIKKAVIARAEKIILLADHTKINKPAGISFAPLAGLHAFVTDRQPPDDYLAFFRQHNIQCVY